ncbi:MAG TPA: hypothetical protein VFG39_03040 [Balneolaceae bacterium]|nr:hypothetical protein [Balneolaceae bacterium]
MKHNRQDLIYIYDNEHQKIIMIHGETGERVAEEDDQVTSLLKYLERQNEPALLRKFAVWCASQINSQIKPIQKKILELAEEAIHNSVEKDALVKLYDKTEGTAIATDTVGLRQGSAEAPGYLAARECINPDPLEGAVQAARFHRLWGEMQQNEAEALAHQPALNEIKAKTTEDAIEAIVQQQTDYLLDMMNKRRD